MVVGDWKYGGCLIKDDYGYIWFKNIFYLFIRFEVVL